MDANNLNSYPNVEMDSRGKRNNNPLNIRATSDNWIGRSGMDKDGYVIFLSMVFGLRAGIRILKTYHKNGFNTLEKIINRFAPPTENNTENYISFIEKRTGINRFTVLSFEPVNYFLIVREMCYYESYYVPTEVEFSNAFAMV